MKNVETVSIKEKILAHLKDGYHPSHLTAWGEFGTHRLAAYIRELRKDGHSIITIMKKSYTGRAYAEYSLR